MSGTKNPFETDDVSELEDTHASDLSNEELREMFYEYVERNNKPNTASFYRTNFRPFYELAEDAGAHLTENASKEIVKRFLENQAETLAPKTVGHRLSAISRFYTVIQEKKGLLDPEEATPVDHLDPQDVDGLSNKTLQETESGEEFYYLAPDEVKQLMDNVPDPRVRNQALIALMFGTGLRGSEVVRIKTMDIDTDEKELTVHSPKLSTNNETELIDAYWRSEKVSNKVEAYMVRRPSYAHAEDSPYLFLTRESERMVRKHLNRIIKKAAENAGIQELVTTDGAGRKRNSITSHVLRHSYAMACLDNGMDVTELKDALNHSNLETTMIYLKRHKEDTKKAVHKYGATF